MFFNRCLLLVEGGVHRQAKTDNDQHQNYPCNANAYSTPEVMSIKDMITQGEFC